jgi:integrase
MGKQTSKLNSLSVSRISKPGFHGDGNGLYLKVGSPTSKSWVFRYSWRGKTRYAGLGSIAVVTLKEARIEAINCRRLLHEGKDPIALKQFRRPKGQENLFADCAEAYIGAHEQGWGNAKHKAQWRSTLRRYAHPTIGNLPVSEITPESIYNVLAPVWTTRNETASRLRGRIERILDFAKVKGWRSGENPAAWKGNLEFRLPNRSRIRKVNHFKALHSSKLSDFMAELAKQNGIAARALEITILCATRTGETLGARWSELDLAKKLWVIPAERTKMRREHRVPLSARAVEVLKWLEATSIEESEFVFPGAKSGVPLSNMAMLQLLKRMGLKGWTVHGMRSSFRDWAAEFTSFPREVAEQALGHSVGSVERAYRRSDLFLKRARLMDAWASFLYTISREANVVKLKGAL